MVFFCVKWSHPLLEISGGLHLLTWPFCLLCFSCAEYNSKVKKIPFLKSCWKEAFGNRKEGILNTPVTPQRIMYCIFSCRLQGPHFNPGIRGSWGSLGRRVVWVSAWGNTVIQTVSFVNFRLISWFWNVKGKILYRNKQWQIQAQKSKYEKQHTN